MDGQKRGAIEQAIGNTGLLLRARVGEIWAMAVEGTVLMRSSRVTTWPYRCGQGHSVGVQKGVWVRAVGRPCGLGDGEGVDGDEKQE